jgi:hypothetical protein
MVEVNETPGLFMTDVKKQHLRYHSPRAAIPDHFDSPFIQ